MIDNTAQANDRPSQRSTDDSLESLLGEVAGDYFQRITSGQRPQIEEYVERYPEIAEQIRCAFPALQVVGDSRAESDGLRHEIEPNSQKTLGDFRILHELGRGGMGVVYEARQLSMGRKVALKVLPFAALAHEQSLRRFRNEVRAAGALNHPNIVPIYSVGDERGVHFFAMQLIRGQTMAEVIAQLVRLRTEGQALHADSISQALSAAEGPNVGGSTDEPTQGLETGRDAAQGPASNTAQETKRDTRARISTEGRSESRTAFIRSAARLGVQAAEALQHAHDEGVLHRDIKPGNLMLDAEGQLYITDFGLARIETDIGVTMTGDLIGTLRYMSPEQALAKRIVIDHRSDIYSLGVTLYELLTLRPPFDGENRQELLKQIAFEDPPKPRQISRSIPRELETIVLKAIEKNPDERYCTAGEMADDLRAFLEDRPIKAKPPTLLQRSAKWSQRNRPLVWSVGTSSALLLVIAVVMLAASNRYVTNERNLKAQQARRAIQAEQLAEKRLSQVDQSLGQTLDAIDRMSTRVSEDLGGTPGLTQFRRNLHKDALDLCQNLLEESPGDHRVRYQVARISFLLAFVESNLGNRPEATRLSRAAISEFERLVDEDSTDPAYQLSLAVAYRQLGWYDADVAARRKLHRRSVALLEPLVTRYASVAEYKTELLTCYTALASHLRSRDAIAKLEYVERAIKLGESDSNVSRGRLGGAYHAYAKLLRGSQRTQDAEQAFLNAISVLLEATRNQTTTSRSETIVHFRRGHAACYQDFAQLLTSVGKPKQADRARRDSMAILEKLSTEFPSVPKYQKMLASSRAELITLLASVGKTKEATVLIREMTPQTDEDYARRATSWEQINESESALADWNMAIKLLPADGDPLIYVNRGELFVEMNDLDNALADFRTAFEKSDDSNAIAFPVGDLSRSLSKRNDFGAAIALAQLAVEKKPDFFMAHVALCEAKLGLHRYEEALEHIAEAIELQPESWLYKRQSVAHFGLQQFDLALADLNTALDLNPDDISTVWWLGVDQVANCPDEGFRAGMRRLADRGVELEVGQLNARTYRAALLLAMGELELARKDLDAIATEDDVAYHSLYQAALLSLRDDDESRYKELCRKMLLQFESSNYALELRFSAWTYALSPDAIDDYLPAIELADRAINFEPNVASHTQCLGALLFRAGKFEDAVKYLNTAAESDRDEQIVFAYGWYFLAMAEHQLDHTDAAQKWLAKAVQQTEQELADDETPWNRRATLELLRDEANTLVNSETSAQQ